YKNNCIGVQVLHLRCRMTKCSGHCRTDSSLIVQNQKQNSLPFIPGSFPNLGPSSHPINPGSFPNLGPSSHPFIPGSIPDLGPSSYPFNPGSKKTQEQSCVYYLMSKNQKGVILDSLLVFIRTMLYPPELLNFRFQEPYRSTP